MPIEVRGRRREVLRAAASVGEPDEHPDDRRRARRASEHRPLPPRCPRRRRPGGAGRRPAAKGRGARADVPAVRQMDRGGTRHYRLLAEILSTALATERNSTDKAQTAGREWGLRMESPSDGDTRAEEAVDRLVEMLDELGFAPERRATNGDQQIGLRHCPFLELAETRTAVVCPIHLGLDAGGHGNLGFARHRRPARGIRRTGSVPGPPGGSGRRRRGAPERARRSPSPSPSSGWAWCWPSRFWKRP